MDQAHPIRTWRKSQTPKVTLAVLAEQVGVTPSHLSEVENGHNKLSLDLAVKLSEKTGIEIAKLARAGTEEVAQ